MPKFYSHFILHQTTLPLYDRPREGFCPLFSKSKIVCADSSRRSPTMCAMWTPLCGRKKGSCVLSSAKISTLFRISEIFQQQKKSFSLESTALHRKQENFFSKTPLFLPHSPIFFAKDAQAFSDCAFRRHYAHARVGTHGHAPAHRALTAVGNSCLHPSPSPLTL